MDRGQLRRALLLQALIGVAIVMLAIHGVSAHDKWADGSPVPAWVKQFCCGPEDVHHYTYDEVKITPQGFVLPDYHEPIPMERALPSQDGDYWAFFVNYPNGMQSNIFCFFAPPGTM